jgi:hypothetical protein
MLVRMYSSYHVFPAMFCSQFMNNTYALQHFKLVCLKEKCGTR